MRSSGGTNEADTESVHHDTYAIALLCYPSHHRGVQRLC